MLAFEGERPGLRPGSNDQVVRFPEALDRMSRVDAHRVVLDADPADEARDDAAAGHDVEHRDLLRDPQRMVAKRNAVAEDRDLHAARSPRQHAGDHVLVMLVDADAVEAELLGVFQLIEVSVVEGAALLGVVDPVREAEPRRRILGRVVKVGGEIGPWHQMKKVKLHGGPPF